MPKLPKKSKTEEDELEDLMIKYITFMKQRGLNYQPASAQKKAPLKYSRNKPCEICGKIWDSKVIGKTPSMLGLIEVGGEAFYMYCPDNADCIKQITSKISELTGIPEPSEEGGNLDDDLVPF